MTINSIARDQMNPSLIKMASMQKINSAADDASGLAIMEKMEAQLKGLDQGTDNTLDMSNLLKTAEGGLSNISDSLQRVRELGVQAMNGIYTDSDRALIQSEVSQLISGIESTAQNTQYNNMKLLDGSFQNKHTASSANGDGATINIGNMTASEGLGLQGFDVTKPWTAVTPTNDGRNVTNAGATKPGFSLEAIDSAISKVSEARGELGAVMNRFEHTVNANNVTMLNLADAKSRIADLDVASAVQEANRARILNQAQIYNQRNQQEQKSNTLSVLL